MKTRTALLLLFLAVLIFAKRAAAQQQRRAESPATKQSKPEDQNSPDEAGKVNAQTGTSNDRLFYTLPNFLSVPSVHLPPLSTAQKFKVVTRGSFDYVEYFWYGALAGISQAQNSEAGYGQGAAGYGKRYGAAFADGTIENYMTGAVLPSLLRQDPRFYESGKGSFWHRTGYAISRIFVTRTDSGAPTVQFLRDRRKRDVRRNFYLQLSPALGSQFGQRRERVGL